MISFCSDNDIHRALSRRCHKLQEHPFLEILAKCAFTPDQLANLCRQKLRIANSFMPTLYLAKEMAEAAGKAKLAMALSVNIADEKGVDLLTGKPSDIGAHESWAKAFYNALDEAAAGHEESRNPYNFPIDQWELFKLDSCDSLDLIVGMIMATEKSIPLDYAAWLKALSAAFPSLAAQGKTGPLLYFWDHIQHDEMRHLPDLVDGYLDQEPGSRGYTIEPDLISSNQARDLMTGIDRAITLRL